jgi:formate/nitrite transporter
MPYNGMVRMSKGECKKMNNGLFKPNEIIENNLNEASGKVGQPFYKVVLLGLLAGAFIAIGGEASNVAVHGMTNAGLAKTVAGTIFPVGLMLILIIGGQLFTGNCLLFMGAVDGRITWHKMLLNWLTIFFSNFLGAIIVSFLVFQSGQFDMSGGQLGAYTIKVAAGKVHLSTMQGVTSGIMCNIIVCGAVLMAAAAKDIGGRCFAIFFPIFAFVVSGFEHCVANMYYLTAGFMAKSNDTYAAQAKEVFHLTDAQIADINIQNIFVKNLLPVTIGNIIGGALFVGGIFYIIFGMKSKKNA